MAGDCQDSLLRPAVPSRAALIITNHFDPRSGPYPDRPSASCRDRSYFRWSNYIWAVYHQQTKNLLVSYSPKKLGLLDTEKGRLTRQDARQAPSSAHGCAMGRDVPLPPPRTDRTGRDRDGLCEAASSVADCSLTRRGSGATVRPHATAVTAAPTFP